jgi:hypothetical protein
MLYSDLGLPTYVFVILENDHPFLFCFQISNYLQLTRKNCFRYLKLMSPLNASICTTTYLERQKCYDPDKKILLKKQLFDHHKCNTNKQTNKCFIVNQDAHNEQYNQYKSQYTIELLIYSNLFGNRSC